MENKKGYHDSAGGRKMILSAGRTRAAQQDSGRAMHPLMADLLCEAIGNTFEADYLVFFLVSQKWKDCLE
jgi:hypothetical protein